MMAFRWLASIASSESRSAQPSDLVRSPCGSVSARSALFPRCARAIPRLKVVAAQRALYGEAVLGSNTVVVDFN